MRRGIRAKSGLAATRDVWSDAKAKGLVKVCPFCRGQIVIGSSSTMHADPESCAMWQHSDGPTFLSRLGRAWFKVGEAVIYNDGDESTAILGEIKELSEDGMTILSRVEARPGEVIEVSDASGVLLEVPADQGATMVSLLVWDCLPFIRRVELS